MPTPSYPLMRQLVRALRIQQNLTQEQLAEKAGLDYKHFQLFELGRTNRPDLSTLEQLGRALDVPPWVLLCDEIELLIAHTGLNKESLTKRLSRKPGRPPYEGRGSRENK